MGDELPLLGLGLPVSGSWATPGTMLHVARRAEKLGYASLWTFQRVLAARQGGSDRLAEAMTTLDHLSAGRVTVGLGVPG